MRASVVAGTASEAQTVVWACREMQAPLLTVEDVFMITGRGLVVVPGVPEAAMPSGEVRVLLRHPNGRVAKATLTLFPEYLVPSAAVRRYCCVLKGLEKTDVPIGTEIWRRQEPIEEGRLLLAAWRQRWVDDASVVAWADDIVEFLPAESIPNWVLDLSIYGPAKCMMKPSSEFIHVPFLKFPESFTLQVSVVDFVDQSSLERFVEWLSRACMGEDLENDMVKFGYYVEHLWGDCGRMDLAIELVREQLPQLQNPQPTVLELVLRAHGTRDMTSAIPSG